VLAADRGAVPGGWIPGRTRQVLRDVARARTLRTSDRRGPVPFSTDNWSDP